MDFEALTKRFRIGIVFDAGANKERLAAELELHVLQHEYFLARPLCHIHEDNFSGELVVGGGSNVCEHQRASSHGRAAGIRVTAAVARVVCIPVGCLDGSNDDGLRVADIRLGCPRRDARPDHEPRDQHQ